MGFFSKFARKKSGSFFSHPLPWVYAKIAFLYTFKGLKIFFSGCGFNPRGLYAHTRARVYARAVLCAFYVLFSACAPVWACFGFCLNRFINCHH